MIDIGYFALCLALLAAGYAIAASAAGAHRQNLPLIRSGENAALAFTGLLTIAVLAIWNALFTHNFQVQFVAENSNRDMPTLYTVAALWGGQSGSLLFWGWLLSLYTAAAVLFNRRRYRTLMPYVVVALCSTGFFFIVLNLFAADPFKKLPFLPADGRGLNPLLQHPLMAIHPPLLYLGMVGMSVPFAFGIAALITRQLDSAWLKAARRWMLIPWTFLGFGLLLGGKWAYVELGWGGYWGWDPVENSSLIPWLAGTAFLHSIMIQERRGMLKVWNMVLVILTYCLCIFGTFLTRSGIISSVHAFAKSNVGPFFMVFLALGILGSAYLLLTRLPELRAESRLESFVSRETAFLLNNWILLGILFAVMWGTLFPVISEAFTDEKITVGPPFFNQVNIPLGLVLLFLIGAGPLFAWRRTSTENLKRNFAIPIGVALPVGAILLVAGMRDIYAIISLVLCTFVITTIAMEFHRGAGARQHSTGESYPQALYQLLNKNRRRYGGYLVHLAMVLLFVGFTGQAFTTGKEFVLKRGESIHISDYTVTYGDIVQSEDANMSVTAAALELAKGGDFLCTLMPAKNFYKTHDQGTTEVSIFSSMREDFYVILVGAADDGSAKFQVYINPLVNWVWIGGVLFLLSSLWCMWPTARERRMAALERASVQEFPTLFFGPGPTPTHA